MAARTKSTMTLDVNSQIDREHVFKILILLWYLNIDNSVIILLFQSSTSVYSQLMNRSIYCYLVIILFLNIVFTKYMTSIHVMFEVKYKNQIKKKFLFDFCFNYCRWLV